MGMLFGTEPSLRKTSYRFMQRYLIEAWALGMFMLSAIFFTGLLEYPGSPVRQVIADPFLRRCLMGLAMGLTAAGIIYSRWGKRSGAHMNPAITFAFLYLDKISRRDAGFYMLAQFAGGAVGILIFKALFKDVAADPSVNYVQTLPGIYGITMAFLAETVISSALLLAVLYSSNHPKTAPYTGLIAASMVMLYITFEAPVSGMSMNPARTMASAIGAGQFAMIWIYFLAPVIGMMGAAFLWKWKICQNPDFHCAMHAPPGNKKEQIPEMLPR
jgi:aquaporin Z